MDALQERREENVWKVSLVYTEGFLKFRLLNAVDKLGEKLLAGTYVLGFLSVSSWCVQKVIGSLQTSGCFHVAVGQQCSRKSVCQGPT